MHADTEYIHLHFDDDVMHSEFIEKTLSYMEPDVGMVFTEANVFNPYTDEVTISTLYNFKNKFKTGVYDSKILEKDFLKDLMLTPAICLYRKKDILDAILSANLPIDFGGNYHGVGADIMMNLLICDRYKKIAVIIEPLVTLGSHDGSITMDASKDREKNLRLIKGYDAFRRYYKLLKFYKNNFLFIKQIVNYGIKKRK